MSSTSSLSTLELSPRLSLSDNSNNFELFFGLVGVAFELDVNDSFVAFADDGELNGVARLVFADEVSQRARGADFYAVNLGDDVFVLKAGFGGRAVFDNGRVTRRVVKIDSLVNGQVVGLGDFGSNLYAVNT